MKLLSNITPRFRADFAGLVLTPKSSIGNIESYLLHCRSLLIKRNSVLAGLVSHYLLTSMNGQRPNMIVNYSVLQQSPVMHRKHTAGCHQHRDGNPEGTAGTINVFPSID